ncbi:hypothetical protein GGE65_005340 [Skermanella aerolata]
MFFVSLLLHKPKAKEYSVALKYYIYEKIRTLHKNYPFV